MVQKDHNQVRALEHMLQGIAELGMLSNLLEKTRKRMFEMSSLLFPLTYSKPKTEVLNMRTKFKINGTGDK